MMIENEHILEFIDGSLEADAEQQLFDAMARQPELRMTLRQFIQIGEGVRSDREAFAPPAHVERALLAGLGLAPIAGAVVSEAAGAGWLARLATLGVKFWPMVATFVAGAFLAGGSTYLAMRPDTDAGTMAQVSRSEQEQPAAVAAPATTEAPLNEMPPTVAQQAEPVEGAQTAVQSVGSSSVGHWRVADHPVNASRQSVTSQQSVTNQPVFAAATDQQTSPSDPASTVPADISRPALLALPRSQPDVQAIIDSLGSKLRRQSPQSGVTLIPGSISAGAEPVRGVVEFRTQSFQRQVVSNNARHPEQAFLEGLTSEDWAGGVYIAITPSFMIGAEGGVERYAQTLAVYHGDTAFIEQMPRYFWAGASARYNFPALFTPGIRPFAQLTGGMNGAGGLLRLRTGLNVSTLSVSGFMLAPSVAFEASSLIYTFNDQPQLAGRWGLTLGLGVQW